MGTIRVEISGNEKTRLLAAKLRIAEKQFDPEMGKALREGARPLPEAARLSALEHLPRRNGLNLVVAAARFSIRRVSEMEYRVTVKGIRQIQRTNEGFITHPTYGHRPREDQAIPKARDWFNRPMRAGKRKISNELGKAMHRIAQRII